MMLAVLAVGAALLAAAMLPGQTAAPPAASTAAASPVELVFLHINDTHGQTQGTGATGGYARLATAVRDVRGSSKAARVFLIDSGDILSKSDALTRRTLGLANIEVMNYLKFDAFVPGNGDFYDGIEPLQAMIRKARFPVLAANVALADPGAPGLARPYVIEKVGDMRIAILGLCFIRTDLPSAEGLTLSDPGDVAEKLVPQLRKQADLVVAMTHISQIEDVLLAQRVPGIDVIFGAHCHSLLPTGRVVNPAHGGTTLVCQAGAMLTHMGKVTVTMAADKAGYRVASAKAEMIDLDQKVKQDPAVKALLAKLDKPASAPAASAASGKPNPR